MDHRDVELLRPVGPGAIPVISLRRHVLTLVAVFLALAVGVVLGSTSVATSIRDAVVDREETTAGQLETTQKELNDSRLAEDRLDALAGDVTPAVTDGRLADRPVLLVVAPGASAEEVDAVAEAISGAGGIDAGRIRLTDRAVDPEADSELSALVANLPIGDAPAADADLGTQLGTALARSAMLRSEDAEPHLEDDDRATVLTTLADAEMIAFEPGTIRPGQLAVVVTGPVEDEAAAVRIASLSSTLDSEGAGVVVVSGIRPGAGTDTVVTLRSSGQEDVSTVDSGGTDAGRLATVLALAEQLERGQGDYGMRQDASAAVPSVPPRP